MRRTRTSRAPLGTAHAHPLSELDAKPKRCAPTPRFATDWSASSGSTLGRPCESSRLASWSRTRPLPRPTRRVWTIPESTQRGNLLERLSSFVGRTEELEELIEAVRSGRLVTLIGPGGVGKTRLALEAAATLRQDHRDGAWLVELASVTEPEGVAPAVGAHSEQPLPASPGHHRRTRRWSSSCAISRGSPLIVLDNCEHVIDQTASLAEKLVAAVPGLRLIATSREALGVRGEVLVPVGPLSLPAAVELFVDRARAVRPGFAADENSRPLLDDICRRLDRLPLAIELAAARLRSLALDTLAARLDDRFRLLTVGPAPPSHANKPFGRWWTGSHDPLFEDERRLFARLSVFVGAAKLDAVEAVCADDQVPIGEVLDVLSRLIDKSLVGGPNAGRETRFTLSRRYGSTAGSASRVWRR